MKVFQYEFPDMLIKVSNNRKYLEDLCAGKVYMNESGYFRKLEDTYRGDKFDGKCVISFENHTGEFMELGPEESPEERIKIPLDFIQNLRSDLKVIIRSHFIAALNYLNLFFGKKPNFL